MKYTKELHDRVRQNLRMFDYPRFDDGDIDALLDRITELEAMTSPRDFNRFMVEKIKDNPELQREFAKTMSDTSGYVEIIDKQARRITALEAENAELRERTRWIPVSERLPENKDNVLCWFDIDCEIGYWSGEAWLNTEHYEFDIKPAFWQPLPLPPESEG